MDVHDRISITTDDSNRFTRGNLYVRTAYRNDHEFVTDTLSRQGAILDNMNLNRFIEPDATVSLNYQRLASQAMEDIFLNEAAGTTMGDYARS